MLSFALRVYGVDEFTDFSSIFRIGTREVLDGSLLGKCLDSSDEVLKSKLEVYLNEWLGIAEMRRNVVTKTEFLILIQDIVEENSNLVILITKNIGQNIRYLYKTLFHRHLGKIVLVPRIPPGHIPGDICYVIKKFPENTGWYDCKFKLF